MRSAFCILVCLGWIAAAQSVPIQILSITPISNGTASVTLKNTATEPIEAYAVTWFVSDVDSHGKPRHVGTRIIRDAAIGLTQKPLGPNDTATVIAGIPGGGTPTVQVQAGLFADGRAFGDADWIFLLQQRRIQCSEILTAVTGKLAAAIDNGIDLQTLIAELNSDYSERRAVAQAQIDTDLKASPDGSISVVFAELNPQMRASNLNVFRDEERRQCTDTVYRPMMKDLQQALRLSVGASRPEAGQTVRNLLTLLTEERDRLRAAPQ